MLLGATETPATTGTFSFLSSTPVYLSSGTSINVTYPTGIQAGDLLFITGLIQSGTAVGASGGWTSLIGSGSYGTVLYKTAIGTESGTVNVSWTGAAGSVHVMVVVRHSSAVTPKVEMAAGAYAANPSISLTPPVASYTQAAHIVNYTDNSAVNMSALNANLTLLQSRSTTYGSWIGWINTSTLGLMNTTITSNSNANTLTVRSFVVYV